jgi:hypothetical protein
MKHGYQSVMVQGARCHAWKRLDGNLQLLIVGMKHNV